MTEPELCSICGEKPIADNSWGCCADDACIDQAVDIYGNSDYAEVDWEEDDAS